MAKNGSFREEYDKELEFLQKMKASGVRSVTLAQELDKQIADLALDDEKLAQSHVEIEGSTQVLGQFPVVDDQQ